MEERGFQFLSDLDEAVLIAEKELEQVTIADEVSDEICEQCGRHMVIKYGPHGRFLACPAFPGAKTQSLILKRLAWPVRNAERILC